MSVVNSVAFSVAGDVFQLVRSMLNDADIPTISIITPTGLVRAATQVTLTTQENHNLQLDDVFQVANADDSTFNGTFTVLTIPTPTSITYYQNVADATSGNGTVELIVQGDVYTNTVLLPFANKAYRKVQMRLLQGGSKTTTTDVEVTLPAGATIFDDNTVPQLPVDFLAPRQMFTRLAGTPIYGPPMSQVDSLPSMQPGALNYCFAWQNEQILFVGALNDTDILLRYFKNAINVLTDATSPILIRGGLDAVADWTAFLAANSRGAANAAFFSGLFNEDMGELKTMQAHSRQYKPGRRISYNRRMINGNAFYR